MSVGRDGGFNLPLGWDLKDADSIDELPREEVVDQELGLLVLSDARPSCRQARRDYAAYGI